MLAAFFTLEIAAQVCLVVCSVLVVHGMDKEHYAWYALAHNLQGTVGLFTEIGVGTALMSLGSQYLGDRARMGALVASAFRHRCLLLAVAAPIALPIFGYLLIKNGCPAWNSALVLLAALAVLMVEFNRQVYSTPVRLAGQYNLLQRASVVESMVRIGAIGGLILMRALNATTTLLVSALVSGYVVQRLLGRAARPLADPHAPPDPELRRRLMRINLHVLPTSLSAVFQGQIGMIMISLFGTTGSVADVGALTRVGLIPAVPLALLTKVIEPKLSRGVIGTEFWKKSLVALALTSALACLTFGVIFVFSHQILWLLGPDYRHLHRELLWFGAFRCAKIVAGLPQLILYARGWVHHFWISSVAEIAFQLAALPFLNLSHPLGVLSLDAIQTAVAFIFYGGLVYRRWLLWKTDQKQVTSAENASAANAQATAG